MKPRLILPTESGKGADLARQLGTILGTAARWASGTVAGAFLLALGDALSDVHTTITGAGDEAFATTATNLLDELETEYGLPVNTTLTTDQRRDRLVAKIRAARAGTPGGIVRAISAIDDTVEVIEITAPAAQLTDEPRLAYRFTVLISDATYDDAGALAAVRQIIEQMKPAHTLGDIASGRPFTLDDPLLGRLDRNVLG